MENHRNSETHTGQGSITGGSGQVHGSLTPTGAAENAASIMIGIASVRSFSVAVADNPAVAAQKVVAPWTAIPGGVIDGGEIVILAIKPSMWRPLFDSAAWMVGSWIIAALLTFLGKPITGLSMTTTVQIVLMGGTVGLGVAILRWIPTWYVLTNRRVIHIHGIRTPRIDSCELLEIRNTFVQVGIEEKVTNLGSITFVMDKATTRPRTWRSIQRPLEVHARIRRAIENVIDQYGIGS
jgi:hypothetical protein